MNVCPHCAVIAPEPHLSNCPNYYNATPPSSLLTTPCEHRFALGPVHGVKMMGISTSYEIAFVLCVNCGQVKKVKVIDESG
jgi:hypothetical protein